MEKAPTRTRFSAIAIQRKQAILDFIRAYRETYEFSPTVYEIAEAVTGKREDAGNMIVWIHQLIAEGFLRRGAKGARTLLLVDRPPRPRYKG